jgi:hypothetical protein
MRKEDISRGLQGVTGRYDIMKKHMIYGQMIMYVVMKFNKKKKVSVKIRYASGYIVKGEKTNLGTLYTTISINYNVKEWTDAILFDQRWALSALGEWIAKGRSRGRSMG